MTSGARAPEWSGRSHPASAVELRRPSPSEAGARVLFPSPGPGLFFDTRFVDQHHGDIVANRINPFALNALEAIPVLQQLDRGLAQRANEDLQQVLADGHDYIVAAVGCGLWAGTDISCYDINVSTSGDLNIAEYRALGEFRYRLRRFLQFSETAAREAGLEPQQHQLLLAIKGLPDGRKASIRELSDRMLLRHHSTVELVDRLEKRGAVSRVADPDDGRSVLVVLTHEGERLLRGLALAHRDELEETGPELLRALRIVLRDVRKGEAA